ncbi:MAG: M48 family metalloprotease [Phycisphaerales bacterium]|nr:M48 family metalloprotease [Planctomycetota bacterium]
MTLAFVVVLSLLLPFARAADPKNESPTPAPTSNPASAGPAPAFVIPPAAQAAAGKPFDPIAATDAYLATIPADQRAKSDAYFEGGYWLRLWGFLLSAAISLGLLASGLSVRIRRLAERLTRFRWLQPLVYGACYLVIVTALTFPLTIYEDFYREHAYGLMVEPLGQWLGEQAIGLLVNAVLGGIAVFLLYLMLRKVRGAWWLWAGAGTTLFLLFVVTIAPVFISPLFNRYKVLDDPAVREPILSLARANRIPAENVYVFDESKQSNRISANVSGALGTMRISMTDNLLTRCSPGAVRAVLGHEMGHYVMNHVYKLVLMLGIVFLISFAATAWGFERLRTRFGIESISDPAGLPLIVLLMSSCVFVLTPVINTIIRMHEAEADAFGLNAAREPDGMAEAAIKLAEYRKMKPGPWEEFIFYDHPSGYDRILRSMTWKAENTAH